MTSPDSPTVIADDGQGQVVRRATLPRPADELYTIVATPELHSAVDGSETVGAVVTSDGRKVHPGSTFTIRMKHFGIPYRITSTVTQAIPGRVLEWRHPHGHHWRWEFNPIDDHTTEVVHTFDYRGNPLRAILRLIGVMRSNATGMEKSIANLASISAPDHGSP